MNGSPKAIEFSQFLPAFALKASDGGQAGNREIYLVNLVDPVYLILY
jgi:hypothetical protein